MTEEERQIAYLFMAELQFRLASAVRLATTLNTQPLDLPTEWTTASMASNTTRLRFDRNRRLRRLFPPSFSNISHGCRYKGRDWGNGKRSQEFD